MLRDFHSNDEVDGIWKTKLVHNSKLTDHEKNQRLWEALDGDGYQIWKDIRAIICEELGLINVNRKVKQQLQESKEFSDIQTFIINTFNQKPSRENNQTRNKDMDVSPITSKNQKSLSEPHQQYTNANLQHGTNNWHICDPIKDNLKKFGRLHLETKDFFQMNFANIIQTVIYNFKNI